MGERGEGEEEKEDFIALPNVPSQKEGRQNEKKRKKERRRREAKEDIKKDT